MAQQTDEGITLLPDYDLLEGTNQVCFEHAASAGFAVDEVYRNKTWSYYSQL